MWALFILGLLLLFGGIVAMILTGSLVFKVLGLVILAMIISTFSGKGVVSGKKDAGL